MHNELTRQDLELMRQELDHRRLELRPQLIEAVKEARAFGDLSENLAVSYTHLTLPTNRLV